MPMYEYKCDSCGKVHEILQKFSDTPLAECPGCGGRVQKLMSLSSFALKGTGWYTTDYKRKSSPSSASSGECAQKGDEKAACGEGACQAAGTAATS